MENSIKRLYYLFIVVFCFVSCTDNSIEKETKTTSKKPSVIINDDTLTVKCNSYQLLTIKVFDKELYTDNLTSGIYKINILSLIKDNCLTEDKWMLSLYATKHNNIIPVSIKVSSSIDTITSMPISPLKESEYNTTIKGDCAPLVSENNNPDIVSETKKWLFRKNEYLPDSLINIMINIYRQLNSSEYNILLTNSKIPVIKSFAGKTYEVSSDIKADHYVLYACSSQTDINSFVEEIVSNDFELTVSNLKKSLNCYRELNTNGIKCITLICINNDWSYEFVPLGLVAIDNIAPTKTDSQSARISSFIFNNNYKVILPADIPEVFGYGNVFVTNWDGNGIKCNVSFKIYHGGDTKYVTIVREYASGNYESYYPKPEKKKILVENKENPFLFTYDIHLTDGDNIIPIIFEDNYGNTSQYDIVIPATFEYINTNSINIDNNIDIFN